MNHRHYLTILFYTMVVSCVCGQIDQDLDLLVLRQVDGINSESRISEIEIINSYAYIAGKGGVLRIDIDSDSDIKVLKKGDACTLKVTMGGKVLTGFNNNILYIDNDKIFQVDSYNPLTNETITINDIEQYGDNMYVATNDGILVFDLDQQTFIEHINERNSELGSSVVNFLFSATNGKLYVGTDAGILIKKGTTKEWSKNYDPNYKYIAATENAEGVWLIADKEIWLENSSDESWTRAGLNQGLYKGNINDIAVDNEGHIYIASDVLVKFNPNTKEALQYADFLDLDNLKCITIECDRNNILWIGTEDSGLFKITKDPNQREEIVITHVIEEAIKCAGENGATIQLSSTGGHPPYTYQWTPASIHGDNPSNVQPGHYIVNVVDAIGSMSSTEMIIEDAIPIDIKVINMEKASSPNSKDGTCEIKVTGGTSPYDILWDNGETGLIGENLNFGFHYITVTDANSCTAEHTFNVYRQSKVSSIKEASLTVGEKLRIENLSFMADSSSVQENSIYVLDYIHSFLTEHDHLIVEIGGHTNNIPPHEYCDKLSEARAKSITSYLIKNGIPKDRLSYKGYGKREPVASNNTPAGRKRNQRVEMKIIAIKD